MGMYNEVFKKCPNCSSGIGYMQIHQIVMGFGGFNLDDPGTMSDLSLSQLKDLKETVYDEPFSCGGGLRQERIDEENMCGMSFRINDPKEYDERQQILKDLSG